MNRLKNSSERMTSILSSDSGQLAVGLAFAFAGILAMFALVFNSSLNTREKMKLQTTSDKASFVAANIQRYNLNNIKLLNEAIEVNWLGLEVELNTSHCTKVIESCPYTNAEPSGITCVASKVASKLGKSSEEIYGACDAMCDSYDESVYDDRITNYKDFQKSIATSILTGIEEANGLAFDTALNTFLYPKNLPQNLFMELENKLGKGFSTQDVINEYEKGGLTTADYAYQILDENKNDPLFIAGQEYRTTIKSNFPYIDVPCISGGGICSCLPPISLIGVPKTTNVPFRITRATDDTTYFYTGIRYSPPPNLMEKTLMLGVKNPDNLNEKFGQNIEGTESDLPLFSRKTKEIQAVSVAKPYGGTFPESGDISGGLGSLLSLIVNGGTSNFSVFGSSGKEFSGAKLFGIADKEEIGDVRIDRADACIDQMDDEGNIMGSVCYKAEDFLH